MRAKRQINGFHGGALLCFGVAFGCYVVGLAAGLVGFSFIGIFFELAAWLKVFGESGGRDDS